jgi:hypothetical protein
MWGKNKKMEEELKPLINILNGFEKSSNHYYLVIDAKTKKVKMFNSELTVFDKECNYLKLGPIDMIIKERISNLEKSKNKLWKENQDLIKSLPNCDF